jgi:predicted house-cleaning noncanonical NTP pyrophosphatase (MazG superfamily)
MALTFMGINPITEVFFVSDYTVDRSILEEKSTEEIAEILKNERDDYTPEAIEIFEEILANRGHGAKTASRTVRQYGEGATTMPQINDYQVNTPGEAIGVLNHLLQGVMDDSIDLQKAQVASNLVMALLQALEREFMTDSGEPPAVK